MGSYILIIVIPMIAFFSSFVRSNLEFSIIGKVEKYEPNEKVYIFYRAYWNVGKKNVIDSCVIVDGNFSFKGMIELPIAAQLRRANGTTTKIFLEKGVNIFMGKTSSDAELSNSPINADFSLYEQALIPFRKLDDAANQYYLTAIQTKRMSSTFHDSLSRLHQENLAKKIQIQKKFIANHPDNYFSFFAFREIVGNSRDTVLIGPIFRQLSKKMQSLPEGQYYRYIYLIEGQTGMGRIAPEFISSDTNEQLVRLSDYRNGYVLLDFWASWCGPCREEMPNVRQAKERFGGKGFTVLGVSSDKEATRENCLKVIADLRMDWKTVFNVDEKITHRYGITSIPRNFLIDPSGKIIGRDLRAEELISTLEKVLK